MNSDIHLDETIPYLSRSEITKLVSPRSKNDTDLDVKFAIRIQENLIAKFKTGKALPKLDIDEPELSDNGSWLRWYRASHACGINDALDAYQLRVKNLNKASGE